MNNQINDLISFRPFNRGESMGLAGAGRINKELNAHIGFFEYDGSSYSVTIGEEIFLSLEVEDGDGDEWIWEDISEETKIKLINEGMTVQMALNIKEIGESVF